MKKLLERDAYYLVTRKAPNDKEVVFLQANTKSQLKKAVNDYNSQQFKFAIEHSTFDRQLGLEVYGTDYIQGEKCNVYRVAYDDMAFDGTLPNVEGLTPWDVVQIGHCITSIEE